MILTGTYANLSQDPADWSLAGFMPSGGEVGPGDRSFSLGESEITLSASVDPYFMANLTAALDGAGEAAVEEAFFRTTSLPHGLSIKGGRFFSGVGYLNEIHAHAWDFIDQPLAYQAFFGGQFAQDGVQLKWLAPTDLFIEFGAETGNGDAFPGTRSTGNSFNGTTLFAHFGGDIGDSIGWRAGLSWVDLDAVDRTYDDARQPRQRGDECVHGHFADLDRRCDDEMVARWRRAAQRDQAAGGIHAARRGRSPRV